MLKQLVVGFPPRLPGFDHGSGHVGLVVTKVVLWHVFSEVFGLPCKSSFQQLMHNHHHLPSGAGASTVPSGLSLTTLRIIVKIIYP
jgi:hypothetical protein